MNKNELRKEYFNKLLSNWKQCDIEEYKFSGKDYYRSKNINRVFYNFVVSINQNKQFNDLRGVAVSITVDDKNLFLDFKDNLIYSKYSLENSCPNGKRYHIYKSFDMQIENKNDWNACIKSQIEYMNLFLQNFKI